MKYSKKFLFSLLFILFVFQGCETAKGFKKDIQNLPKTDKWLQEHLW